MENFNVKKVLLVDDDKNLSDSLRMYFIETKGIFSEEQVLTASSKAEAIQQLEKNEDIDIIILDVVMENNTSGLEVVEYLRKKLNRAMTQIILHTGQAGGFGQIGQQGEELMRKYWINYFVDKSGNPDKLLFAIYAAIRSCLVHYYTKEDGCLPIDFYNLVTF